VNRACDRFDGLARELLKALRDEPLEVHQLAAELTGIPVAVTAEPKALMNRGLIRSVTISWSGCQAWGLTRKGQLRLEETGR
jgi:hypothetical protein